MSFVRLGSYKPMTFRSWVVDTDPNGVNFRKFLSYSDSTMKMLHNP